MLVRITVTSVRGIHPARGDALPFTVTHALVGSIPEDQPPMAGYVYYGTTTRYGERYRLDVPEWLRMNQEWAGRIVDNYAEQRGSARFRYELEVTAYDD